MQSPAAPTLLLQTLRRAASLLATRPHLLQPEWTASPAATAAAVQRRSAASAAASASASASAGAASAAPPTSTSSSSPSANTSTTTTSNASLLPPHIDQAYLAAARARVFDHALQQQQSSDAGGAAAAGRRSGRKPLLAPLRGRELNSWYVTAQRDAPPLLENDEESQRLERVALAKSAGRAPPKKGQGKRSGGKKKK